MKILKSKIISEDYYKELSLASYLNYMYGERAEFSKISTDLSKNIIFNTNLKNILVENTIFMNYNESMITKILDSLIPENSLICISNNLLTLSNKLNISEFKFRDFILKNENNNFIEIDNIFSDFIFKEKEISEKKILKNNRKNPKNLKKEAKLPKKVDLNQKKSLNKVKSIVIDKKLDKYDPIMKIYYSTEKISKNLLEKFKQGNYSRYNFSITFQENNFIPKNLELKTNCKIENKLKPFISQKILIPSYFSSLINNKIEQKFKNSTKIFLNETCFADEVSDNSVPTIYSKNENISEIWVKKENSFMVPKIRLSIQFLSPNLKSLKNATLAKLIINYLSEKITDDLYKASELGMFFNLEVNNREFKFNSYGFSDKINKLILIAFKNMKGRNISESIFKLIKEQYLRDLNQQKMSLPLKKSKSYLNEIIFPEFYNENDIIAELTNLTLLDYNKFSNNIFKNLYIKALITGSCDSIIIDEILSDLSTYFPTTQIKNLDLIQSIPVRKINESNEIVFRRKNENPKDLNNAILNYYQFDEVIKPAKEEIFIGLLQNLIDDEAFNYLREEKNLGYTVIVDQEKLSNYILSIFIGVQGSEKSPYEMDKNIEELLNLCYKRLESLPFTIFENYVQSFLMNLENYGDSLEKIHNKFWEEISIGTDNFDLKNEYLKILKNVNKKSFLNFYLDFFKKNSKKISIQIFAKEGSDKFNLPIDVLSSNESYSKKNEKIENDLNKFNDFKIYETHPLIYISEKQIKK